MRIIKALDYISPDDWNALDPLSRAGLVAAVLDACEPAFEALVDEALDQETVVIAFDDLAFV